MLARLLEVLVGLLEVLVSVRLAKKAKKGLQVVVGHQKCLQYIYKRLQASDGQNSGGVWWTMALDRGQEAKIGEKGNSSLWLEKRQKFASQFAYGDSPYGNGQVEKKITIWGIPITEYYLRPFGY